MTLANLCGPSGFAGRPSGIACGGRRFHRRRAHRAGCGGSFARPPVCQPVGGRVGFSPLADPAIPRVIHPRREADGAARGLCWNSTGKATANRAHGQLALGPITASPHNSAGRRWHSVIEQVRGQGPGGFKWTKKKKQKKWSQITQADVVIGGGSRFT